MSAVPVSSPSSLGLRGNGVVNLKVISHEVAADWLGMNDGNIFNIP